MVALPPRFDLVRYGAVGSTNTEAERLAAAGAADGLLITATEQTNGRGRVGRPWQSPPGNLYCSLLLRPACKPDAAANLSFVAALALSDAVTRLIGTAAGSVPPAITCKWPNDVLIDAAKVAGILLDSVLTAAGRVDHVIIGTGVNVASAPARTDGAHPAVALSAWAPALGIDEVLGAHAYALDHWLAVWERGGFAPIRTAWLNRAHGLGRRLVARVGDAAIEGVFLDLDSSGALLIGTRGGGQHRVAAGDVFPLVDQA